MHEIIKMDTLQKRILIDYAKYILQDNTISVCMHKTHV